jgi:hypothetical protein
MQSCELKQHCVDYVINESSNKFCLCVPHKVAGKPLMNNTRDINRARVFEVIHLIEPVSRVELAQHSGLSAAPISNTISEDGFSGAGLA